MKLRDVLPGLVFTYLEGLGRGAKYLKLHNNKFLQPPAIASSLTELAAQIGPGGGSILHCNPESEVLLAD